MLVLYLWAFCLSTSVISGEKANTSKLKKMACSVLEFLFVCFWPETDGREGCGVQSNTFLCQVVVMRENSRVWSRAREQFLPNFVKQKKQQFWPKQLERMCYLLPPGARTYDHLKKTRDEERLKRTMLSEVLQYIQDSSACQQWLSRQANMYGYSKTAFHTRAVVREVQKRFSVW